MPTVADDFVFGFHQVAGIRLGGNLPQLHIVRQRADQLLGTAEAREIMGLRRNGPVAQMDRAAVS